MNDRVKRMWRRIFMVLLACASCGHRYGRRPLSETVQLYCSDLRADLGRATSQYSQLAGWITVNKISEAQQRRAEIMLEFGTSDEARAFVSRDLTKRFYFCADVHAIDTQRFDRIIDQVSDLTGKFQETTDRIEMSKAIAKLNAIAVELYALPMRD